MKKNRRSEVELGGALEPCFELRCCGGVECCFHLLGVIVVGSCTYQNLEFSTLDLGQYSSLPDHRESITC